MTDNARLIEEALFFASNVERVGRIPTADLLRSLVNALEQAEAENERLAAEVHRPSDCGWKQDAAEAERQLAEAVELLREIAAKGDLVGQKARDFLAKIEGAK